MKTYLYKKEQVKIIQELNIKDKHGNWVQVEFVSGDKYIRGTRVPAVMEDLK
jgi:hypothetical protein